MTIDQNFTPLASTLGGLLIGLASTLLLLMNGKIAGISGIVKASFWPAKNDLIWRILFILGLIIGGFIINILMPQTTAKFHLDFQNIRLIIAGLLVGFGTALANGCTSGHGICGLSRKSKRSIWAVISFMLAGFITSFILNQIIL